MCILDKMCRLGKLWLMAAFFTLLSIAPSAAQEEADVDAYYQRVIDKVLTTETQITSCASRINYLQSLLKEDLNEVKKIGTKAEIDALKLRIDRVKELNKTAQKHSKSASKKIVTIQKIATLDTETRIDRTSEVKQLVEEISEINQLLINLAEEAVRPAVASPNSVIHPDTSVPDTASEPSTTESGNTDKPKEEQVEKPKKQKKQKQKKADDTETSESTSTVTEQPTDSADATAADTRPKKEQRTAEQNDDNTRLAPDGRRYAKYTRGSDVLLNPPVVECQEVRTDTDPFTGKPRRITQSEELFHFTNAYMRNNLKGKQHITCYAEVIETRKRTFLFLRFVINDANGARNFGPIRTDVPIMVKFVDETKVVLQNGLSDAGQYDASGQVYTVNASMELWQTEKGGLAKAELDKIRIPWTNGYEEYEVYRVDLLQRLLKCL